MSNPTNLQKYFEKLMSQDDFNYRKLKIVTPNPIPDSEAPFYLVGFEAYNPGKKDIILVNEILRMNWLASRYVAKLDGNLGPKYIKIKTNDRAYVPHGFYMCYTEDGSPATLTKIYGKEKFKGHVSQSAPEPFRRRDFEVK